MSKDEVIEKLKKLKQSKPDISWSGIERRIKMPKNNLVGMITGSRAMPQKWIDALEEFLKRFENNSQNFIVNELYRFTTEGWVHENGQIATTKLPEASKKKDNPKSEQREWQENGAKEMAENDLELTDEQKKAHNEELRKLIKEIESRKCPSYMQYPIWLKRKEREIESIKKQIIII